MNELSGKVAIVTGSSRGIGEAIARRFAQEGAKVVVTARTVQVRDERLPGTVNTVADSIKAAGGEALAIPANLQKKEDRERLVSGTIDAYGGVDILVNNAAILVMGGMLDFEERYYDRMFELLVKAPFHLCQLVVPVIAERGGGSVLNISSIGALHPKPGEGALGGPVYGMCKAALERMTTGMAAEFYGEKISSNALSPSLGVATPGQMFGRTYTQEMLDATEPPEAIAEASLALVTGDPTKTTGGIRFTDDVLEEFGRTPVDIGMEPPKPN